MLLANFHLSFGRETGDGRREIIRHGTYILFDAGDNLGYGYDISSIHITNLAIPPRHTGKISYHITIPPSRKANILNHTKKPAKIHPLTHSTSPLHLISVVGSVLPSASAWSFFPTLGESLSELPSTPSTIPSSRPSMWCSTLILGPLNHLCAETNHQIITRSILYRFVSKSP